MDGNSVGYYEFSKDVLPSASAAEASWSRASGDPYDAEGAWGAISDTPNNQAAGYYGQKPVKQGQTALDKLMMERQMGVSPGAPAPYDRAPMTRSEQIPYTNQGWLRQGEQALQSQGYDTIENRWRYGAYAGSDASFPGYQHYREETQGFDHNAKAKSYPVNYNMHWLEQEKAKTAKDFVDKKKRLSPQCRHELSNQHATAKTLAYGAFVTATMVYMNATPKETVTLTALALGLGAALSWTPGYEK
jgi:hypothetical protein